MKKSKEVIYNSNLLPTNYHFRVLYDGAVYFCYSFIFDLTTHRCRLLRLMYIPVELYLDIFYKRSVPTFVLSGRTCVELVTLFFQNVSLLNLLICGEVVVMLCHWYNAFVFTVKLPSLHITKGFFVFVIFRLPTNFRVYEQIV